MISSANKKPLFYLMCETSARELHGKLFLASVAASRGCQVVLGSQPAIRNLTTTAPSGIFLENGLNYERTDRLRNLKHRGFVIASLCEEATAYIDPQGYCDERISLEAAEYCDLVLQLGPEIHEWTLKYRPSVSGKSIVTGNPRFDLLRPGLSRIYTADALEILSLRGPYVLVNTNFGCNPHPVELIDSGYEGYIKAFAGSDHVIRARLELSKYESAVMEFFKQAIPSLIDDQNISIVVRPHPKENYDTWLKWASMYPRISIDASGDVRSWILGASAVLHNNCTTGIEAFLLGKAPYVLHPPHVLSSAMANSIPNQLSIPFSEPFSRNLLYAGSEKRPSSSFAERAKVVSHRIMIQLNRTSADFILDALTSMQIFHELPRISVHEFYLSLCSWTNNFRAPNDPLTLQQMPGLPYGSMANSIRIWKKYGHILNGVFIKPVSPSCCVVSLQE
jgi:surface carbohydrate biosynthesis protein